MRRCKKLISGWAKAAQHEMHINARMKQLLTKMIVWDFEKTFYPWRKASKTAAKVGQVRARIGRSLVSVFWQC